jgi:hypothetical protein
MNFQRRRLATHRDRGDVLPKEASIWPDGTRRVKVFYGFDVDSGASVGQAIRQNVRHVVHAHGERFDNARGDAVAIDDRQRLRAGFCCRVMLCHVGVNFVPWLHRQA